MQSKLIFANCIVVNLALFVVAAGINPSSESQPAHFPTTAKSATTAHVVQEDRGLIFDVQLPKELISGKENVLAVIVKNRSGVDLDVNEAVELKGLRLSVRYFSGAAEPTRLYIASTRPNIGLPKPSDREPRILHDGHDLHIRVNLTRYFDFSMPGDYTIDLSWIGRVREGKDYSISASAHVRVVEERPEGWQPEDDIESEEGYKTFPLLPATRVK